MFEAAELGAKLSKGDYARRMPSLRLELLRRQYELKDRADFPVVVLIAGEDRRDSNDVINRLHEWMDPRYLEANAFGLPTTDERERPRYWRYWRVLPAAGRVGVFFGGWAFRALIESLPRGAGQSRLDLAVEHIRHFEKMLVDDGALIVKFWLHRPEDQFEHRKQAEAVEGSGEDDWFDDRSGRLFFRNYERSRRLAERLIRLTSTGEAPWYVVESTDARHRDVAVAHTLGRALAARLDEAGHVTLIRPPEPAAPADTDPHTILDQVDLSRSISEKKYERLLARWQSKLRRLSHEAQKKGVSSVLVFEGWDAAGKGGAIRRLTAAMDATRYRVVPTAAPSDEERAHHYLWRFWRQLPRGGHMAIFDRSWYGRVLVERVEGLAASDEWMRAYSEINDFEEQLDERGTVLVKFWLHIDPEEQLRRLKDREKTPFKKYKVSADDYRNREQWSAYETAANEMIGRTSTEYARWKLVPGNDKHYARIKVLKTVCRRLSAAL